MFLTGRLLLCILAAKQTFVHYAMIDLMSKAFAKSERICFDIMSKNYVTILFCDLLPTPWLSHFPIFPVDMLKDCLHYSVNWFCLISSYHQKRKLLRPCFSLSTKDVFCGFLVSLGKLFYTSGRYCLYWLASKTNTQLHGRHNITFLN